MYVYRLICMFCLQKTIPIVEIQGHLLPDNQPSFCLFTKSEN